MNNEIVYENECLRIAKHECGGEIFIEIWRDQSEGIWLNFADAKIVCTVLNQILDRK